MVNVKARPAVNTLVGYDDDYYLWFNQQAELLRNGQISAADLENIAEELEDMGKRELRGLISAYRLILSHLLKWQFQPERRTNSWKTTIGRERRKVRDREKDSPSLRAKIAEILPEAYDDAVVEAADETELPLATFPAECPWTLNQIRDVDFLPQ